MKTCKVCRKELPLDSFHKKLGKHRPLCKDCRRATQGATKRAETLEEYFWRYTPRDLSPDVCWEWTGARFTNDYGKKTYGQGLFKRQHYRMHRVAYELFKGEIPENIVVAHLCNNPPCVNPNHLYLATRLENSSDAARDQLYPKILQPDDVLDIRRMYEEGHTYVEMAAKYNVGTSTITGVVRLKNHRYIK